MKNLVSKNPQLLRLINHLPGSIFQYREWNDGRCSFTYVSPGIEDLLFATAHELEEDANIAWNRLSEEMHKDVRRQLDESKTTLTEITNVFQIIAPDGTPCWIKNHSVPEKLEDGSTCWYGYMENITAQHHIQEASAQKTAMLEVIFETLPDHIYYKDKNLQMIGVNPACCAYHKRTAEEMIGKTDLDFYSEELGKELYANELRLMATGIPFHGRERHEQEDGSVIYMDSVKTPLLDKDGKIIGLAGISRDITQQVENEQASLRAKKEAEENSVLIKAIFETLPDQIYYKDAKARILGANSAYCTYHGFECAESMIGKTDQEIYPIQLGQQIYNKEISLMISGQTVRERERHVQKDRSVTYLESVKSPLKNKDGKTIGLVGISRDITEQVERENELIAARKEAIAANQAKSSFLAMMSHEIRTPMNGVIGAASLLRGTELSAEQAHFSETIQTSGEDLLNIINDILDYSKIEAGKVALETIPFNLAECIENTFDLFIQRAAEKNIELLHYVEPDVPVGLIGDPSRLRQIIVNLLGNALKFTQEGEVSLRVKRLAIDHATNRCQLEIAVQDTGIGITEEAQKRLFQSFTQADSSSTRKYGGTGLGLAISKRLTELMGGRIWITSKKGEGSTFHFTISLPIASDALRKIDEPVTGKLTGKCVLIVDDNETNRDILCAQMKQWGAIPRAFEFPEEALQHLKGNPAYDIALLDYQMPTQNGLDLAKAIKERPTYQELPIIILSSAYETVEAHPAVNVRMAKPVRIQKLRKNMLQLLGENHVPLSEPTKPNAIALLKNAENLRILVAEDNPVNQRIVLMMLKRLGCKHTTLAEDGLQAVAAVKESDYDLVLMDIQMPNMNGIQASEAIRKHTQDKTHPWVIALTAGVMQEERVAIEKSGINDFLAKPVNITQLAQKLSSIHFENGAS
jgi:PAS domain S-box-containing protein